MLRALGKAAAVVLALTVCLAATSAASLAAEKYPSRTIELIVPTGPGGGTDSAMRVLAGLLEPHLGQKVVVVNKPGAGGMLGMAAITEAKPDGYTLGGLWSAPLVITPHTLGTRYRPGDYTAISEIDTAPDVLCARPDFPADNARELVEELKKNPGSFTYGTDGVGGTIHLVMERVFNRLGVEVRPVPLSGAAESLTNFLGGHVTFYTGSIQPIVPHVKAGSAKCLLVTSPERGEVLPQASSLTDLGIPDAATELFRGVIGPKGIPADRVAVLVAAIQKVASTQEFRDFMRKRGSEVVGSSSEKFRKVLEVEYEAIGQLVKKLGLAQQRAGERKGE